jgi:hypothetical protein
MAATITETGINGSALYTVGNTTLRCICIGNDYSYIPQGLLNIGGLVYSSGVPVSRIVDIFDTATNAYIGSTQSDIDGIWLYENLPQRPSGYYVIARGNGSPEEDVVRLDVDPPELNIILDVNLIITRTYSG